MKVRLFLVLLLQFLWVPWAFAQIHEENGVCSGPTDDGRTVEWGCSEAIVTPPPPPPPPPASLRIVALGDSWVDTNVGGYWSVYLANQVGADLDNHGVSGAPTDDILQQLQSHLAAHGTDGEYFIWYLPNDCKNISNLNAKLNCVLTEVPANTGLMAQALSQAGIGADRVHILSQVDGGLLCTADAQAVPVSLRNWVTNRLNTAIDSAISSYGYSLHDVNGLFNQMYAERGCAIWKDGKHFSNQTNHEVADYLEATFF